MNTPTGYVPSVLSTGEHELLRQHALTRWMTRDLAQAATDFCRNLGQLPIYCEAGKEGVRYLFWHLPRGAYCEVRTGRTAEKFVDFDANNHARGWKLLSLHVSDDGLHSAVWLSEEQWVLGRFYLSQFGIGAAQRLDSL